MSAVQSSRARRIGVQAGHDSYKWWALSCTSLGMLLATINSGTLIIALPDLERSLHTSLLELVWVILVYMIASTVLVLSAGRLSDQFGRKKAYIGGFVLFAVASLGAGFADNGTQLILWRILQGISGSFLFANSAAIVTDAFPREQLGMAMGTNTMVAAIGLVIGPVLGGALVLISWHWVFWFNVPFALGGSAWAWLILHEVSGRSEDRSFDALGTDRIPDWAHRARVRHLQGRPLRMGRDVGDRESGRRGGVSPGFVAIESRVRSPMLDLSIFKNRLFAAASLAAFMNGPGAVRADVRVRLLLPGRAGQLADPRRNQARPAGTRNARRLAAGGNLGLPARLAWDGRGRDARPGRRAGVDDHAATRHRLRRARRIHADRRDWVGNVQLPQHRGDDGHGSGAPPRDRCRRPRCSSRTPVP